MINSNGVWIEKVHEEEDCWLYRVNLHFISQFSGVVSMQQKTGKKFHQNTTRSITTASDSRQSQENSTSSLPSHLYFSLSYTLRRVVWYIQIYKDLRALFSLVFPFSIFIQPHFCYGSSQYKYTPEHPASNSSSTLPLSFAWAKKRKRKSVSEWVKRTSTFYFESHLLHQRPSHLHVNGTVRLAVLFLIPARFLTLFPLADTPALC